MSFAKGIIGEPATVDRKKPRHCVVAQLFDVTQSCQPRGSSDASAKMCGTAFLRCPLEESAAVISDGAVGALRQVEQSPV